MTVKEELRVRTDRLERARIKAEEFVAAGGDLKSPAAAPIGLELMDAFNEVSSLFGHPILKATNEEHMSPGIYLQQRVEQRSLEVAKTNNAAGYTAMWPEIAKEVLKKFPGLSQAEKLSLRGNIAGQIQLYCARTRSDPHSFTGALREVARILG